MIEPANEVPRNKGHTLAVAGERGRCRWKIPTRGCERAFPTI